MYLPVQPDEYDATQDQFLADFNWFKFSFPSTRQLTKVKEPSLPFYLLIT